MGSGVSKRITTGVVLFMCASVIWGCNTVGQPGRVDMAKDPQKIPEQVLEVADNRARELGFSPEEHDKRVSQDGDAYIIDYVPKRKNRLEFGGGVQIWIDGKTLKVVREVHMQ